VDVRVDGKVALVTGASRGIGEAVAAELLASGARGVVITSRKPDNVAAAAARLGDPDRVLPLVAKNDVPEDARMAVAATVDRFGSCDILVNNAGTNPVAGDLADVDLGGVLKTWAVNQFGPLLYAREAWNQWMKEHGGSVVNVASVAGLGPGPLLGAYNVSKAGVIHLTRQLALEMAPGVRVNAVAPAVVKTALARALWEGQEEMVGATHPLNRLGEVEDVANAIVFLASDRASWITGVTLPVDGGVSGATAIHPFEDHSSA
jgi:3-oxoacyl-[acyl-carrier protein] reductase